MIKSEKKQKKIMFIIPSMVNGGAERVIATLANKLSKLEYSILIITLTNDKSYYKLNESVKIIGAGYKINRKNKIKEKLDLAINGIKGLFYIKSNIKKFKPDITISFLTHTNILSIVIKIINPEIKLIVSERAEPNQRKLLTRIATKYLYPISDKIVCQSKKVSKFFPKYSKNKIEVIENPINLESILNNKPKVRRKVIIAVGRLSEQKNFSLLINSFDEIKNEFPEYMLEIYGEGPLRKRIEKQIDYMNLNDRVKLMGIRKNVMKHVSDAELFVMSSNYEGFPNVLVEAMASGMPVISTDFSTGVARDLIKEENGIIVPVNNQSAMSNAIREILSDKSMQQIMSEKNKKIKQKLSIDIIIKKWINLFEELII